MFHRCLALIATLVVLVSFVSPASAGKPVPPKADAGGLWQDAQIEVSTEGASSISASTATANGFLASLGPYQQVQVWFEGNGITTPKRVMSAPGPFNYRLSGLQSGTTYQYRALASSGLMGGQTNEGLIVEFTTQHTVPQAPIDVQTNSASSVTSSTAVLYGYLSNPGPYDNVQCSFQYGPSPNFGNSSGGQALYGPGPFSLQVSGLIPNTTYYFRAAAKPGVVGVSEVHGATITFTTSGAAALSVSTGAESNITFNSANIIGYLNSLGDYGSGNVWFQWGPTAAYGQTTPMQTMYNPGPFNFALFGLAPGTTYHFRAMGTSGVTGSPVVNGRDSQFTTNFAPGVQISTGQAGDVTTTSAVFNGFMTSLGSSISANVWFEYGNDPSFGNSTARQTVTAPGAFTAAVSRLNPGMTYYYRAAAYSNGYTFYGQSSQFQTKSGSPVSITTGGASGMTQSSATLNAYVNSLGGARSAIVLFNFGTNTDMTMTAGQQLAGATGPVSTAISGLIPGTSYYYQAIAQMPDGSKSYGSVETFTTLGSSKVAVSTLPASSITMSSAVLDGSLDNLAGAGAVQVWFEYGPTADFGNSTPMQARTSPGPYSATVTGLSPNSTYYFRAMGLNATGGGQAVHSMASSFVTSGSPTPAPPSPETPAFVWLIGLGFVVIIIILIVMLVSRR